MFTYRIHERVRSRVGTNIIMSTFQLKLTLYLRCRRRRLSCLNTSLISADDSEFSAVRSSSFSPAYTGN